MKQPKGARPQGAPQAVQLCRCLYRPSENAVHRPSFPRRSCAPNRSCQQRGLGCRQPVQPPDQFVCVAPSQQPGKPDHSAPGGAPQPPAQARWWSSRPASSPRMAKVGRACLAAPTRSGHTHRASQEAGGPTGIAGAGGGSMTVGSQLPPHALRPLLQPWCRGSLWT